MPYKSSEGRETGKLTQVFRSVKTVLGQRVGQGSATGSSIKAITASGGTETTVVGSDGNTYKVHTFTTVGINTLTVSAADSGATCYVVVQAGGGGGGRGMGPGSNNPRCGGGGGSGLAGYFQNIPLTTSPGSYTVTVGDGGAGGINDPTPYDGSPGGNSSFSNPTITITLSGGLGGTGGMDNSAGPGGGSGSITSFTPSTSGLLLHAMGTAGCQANGGSGGGSGGDIWSYSYTSKNLIYVSPDPVANKGNGGGGGANGNGTAGNAGYVRVFYRIS